MRRKLALLAGAAISPLLSVTGAQAQVLLETVVVTAQKVEEDQQRVPISLTALSGNQLQALGLDNTLEIVQQVPNLRVQSFSPNITTFNIRGVSQAAFSDHNEAPIAVYVDDAYLPSQNVLSQQLFDLERVEVLRGPQGTLFGRNATGGLIQYVSRRADDEELNGYL